VGVEPDDILKHMRVPKRPGIYVLGVFERRITLYSQQVRALNLVYSLAQSGRLKEGSRLAVVGAGAAGLTAAAAAAVAGARVSVFDRLHHPLALIRGNPSRWLHPHIYEWPLADPRLLEPTCENAGLPLLNWRADTANVVAETLKREFERLQEAHLIDFHGGVDELQIAAGSEAPYQLDWIQEKQPNQERFDAVILAVGFGVEREVPGVPFHSYWRPDELDDIDPRYQGRPRRYLVSGCGDGGLVDLLRLRIDGFRHQDILKTITSFLPAAKLQAVEERIRQIEAVALRKSEDGNPYAEELNQEYRRLAATLGKQRPFELRGDTEVVLTGLETYPLDLRSSPINRFLVALTDYQYVPGPYEVIPDSGQFRVTFNDGRADRFDQIILRHGPEPALQKYFPEIRALCEPLQNKADLDQTRYPIYGDFYSKLTGIAPASRVSNVPPAREPEPHSRLITPSSEPTSAPAASVLLPGSHTARVTALWRWPVAPRLWLTLLIASVLAAGSNWLDRIDRLVLAGAVPLPKVVTVTITQDSVKRLADFPSLPASAAAPQLPARVPRSQQIRLVQLLDQAGARVIVLDFKYPWRDRVEDLKLAQALKSTRNAWVVVPYLQQRDPDADSPRTGPVAPLNLESKDKLILGHETPANNESGNAPEVVLLNRWGPNAPLVPFLSLAAVSACEPGRSAPATWTITDSTVGDGTLTWSTKPGALYALPSASDYLGKNFEFADVLDRVDPPEDAFAEAFQGSIVVVGSRLLPKTGRPSLPGSAARAINADLHRTRGPDRFGVDIVAATCRRLLRQSKSGVLPERSPWNAAWYLAIVLLVLGVRLAAHQNGKRRVPGWVIAVGVTAIVLAAGCGARLLVLASGQRLDVVPWTGVLLGTAGMAWSLRKTVDSVAELNT
jgi:CHASE2 domain-containing sensor protein